MTRPTDPSRPLLRLSPLTMATLLLILAVTVVRAAMWFATKLADPEGALLLDFDVFHLAGSLVWMGSLEDAYRFDLFREHQRALTGTEAFMPWTYPPTFDLVVAPLALLPVGPAFFLFVGGTLAAYLLTLRALAGAQFGAVLVSLFPTLVLTAFIGQNGFLTGTLVGLFALGALRGALRGGRWAGIPLGLMAIKPHLALGLGAFLLLGRRWTALIGAAASAILLSLVATLVFGLGIWGAFLHGLEESAALLEAGEYPLQRMTSVYAGLRSLGVASDWAFGVHAAVALAALATVQAAVVRGWRQERVLATALLATLMMSPYNYDYDMPVLGLALALALRALVAPAARRLVPLAGALAALVGILPVVMTKLHDAGFVRAHLSVGDAPYSLAPAAFLALAGLLVAMMRLDERAEATRPATAAAPAF